MTRIGVLLHERRVLVVGLRGRGRLQHFVVEATEDVARTLAAELQTRGLARGRVRLGLDRRRVVVKRLELPRAERADVARMIAFELERHVPFPPEGSRADWTELPSAAPGPRCVLLAAADTRTVERARAVLGARRPRALAVACHALPALLPRGRAGRFAVWVHRHADVADLLLLAGRTVLTSRQVGGADPSALAHELRRTLPLVDRTACEEVWLSGDGADAGYAGALGAALGVPVTDPPLAPAAHPLVAALPVADRGALLLALALATGSRSPALNLLPPAARPWTPSRGQLVTAAMLALTAGLGLALAWAHVVAAERHLGRLTAELRRLDDDAAAVERLARELGQTRRVLATLGAAEAGQVDALPVLRELTEALPPDAWLQSLAMDRQGVELTGQADAAGGLVPLLEASSRLERVELTSPVTRAQAKEQFRIRGAWEDGARGR
jgi:Tfp pilus assembly protein PilN